MPSFTPLLLFLSLFIISHTCPSVLAPFNKSIHLSLSSFFFWPYNSLYPFLAFLYFSSFSASLLHFLNSLLTFLLSYIHSSSHQPFSRLFLPFFSLKSFTILSFILFHSFSIFSSSYPSLLNSSFNFSLLSSVHIILFSIFFFFLSFFLPLLLSIMNHISKE